MERKFQMSLLYVIGDQMLSGDSFGAICIWTCVLSGNKERRRSKGMVDGECCLSQ